MPQANTTPTAKPVVEQVKAPAPKKAVATVYPITEEEIVEVIQDLLNEWSEQNQGVAKIDISLGSFRTIVQTERTPVVD